MGHIIAMDPALEFYFVHGDFFSLRGSSAYDVFFFNATRNVRYETAQPHRSLYYDRN